MNNSKFEIKLKKLSVQEATIPIIFILGITGNIFNIFVMRSRSMRDKNGATFVLLISVFDTAYLLLRNFGLFYKSSGLYHFDTTCFITNSMSIVTEVLLMLSVWTLLLSSTERAVSVLQPLHVTQIFLKKRCITTIKTLSVVFFGISCLYYFPCIGFDVYRAHCRINETCFYFHKVFYLYRSSISAWLPSLLSMVLKNTSYFHD